MRPHKSTAYIWGQLAIGRLRKQELTAGGILWNKCPDNSWKEAFSFSSLSGTFLISWHRQIIWIFPSLLPLPIPHHIWQEVPKLIEEASNESPSMEQPRSRLTPDIAYLRIAYRSSQGAAKEQPRSSQGAAKEVSALWLQGGAPWLRHLQTISRGREFAKPQ